MPSDSCGHTGHRKRQRMDEVSSSLSPADTKLPTTSILEQAFGIASPNAHQNTAIGTPSTLQASNPSPVPADPSPEPSFPLLKLLTGDVVKVCVGSGHETKTYTVFKNALIKKSPFFASAFNPDKFRESHDKKIALPEGCPFIFEIVLHWIYSSELPSFSDFLEARRDLEMETSILLLQLYNMADLLLLSALQELCLKELKVYYRQRSAPSFAFIQELYLTQPPTSPLCKLFVEMCDWNFSKRGPNSRKDQWLINLEANETFAADVAKVIGRRSKNSKQLDYSQSPYNVEGPQNISEHSSHPFAVTIALILKGVLSGLGLDGTKLLESLRETIRNASVAVDFVSASKQWPFSHPSVAEMVSAGFYFYQYHNKDNNCVVRCLHCKKRLSKWREGLDPLWIHQKRSPDCPFMKAVNLGLDPPLLPSF